MKNATRTKSRARKGQLLCTGLYLLLAALAATPSLTIAGDSQDIWQDVKSGTNLIILRHALAPGTGDPEHFELNRCDTQRNLSTAGLQQAQRIGRKLKDHGIKNAAVYTSQWCRCIDTAEALDLGKPQALSTLNSFYATPQAGPAQIAQLKQWLSDMEPQGAVVLVTHQVVITALTGAYPQSGEAIIFKLDDDRTADVIQRLTTK